MRRLPPLVALLVLGLTAAAWRRTPPEGRVRGAIVVDDQGLTLNARGGWPASATTKCL